MQLRGGGGIARKGQQGGYSATKLQQAAVWLTKLSQSAPLHSMSLPFTWTDFEYSLSPSEVQM